MKESCRIETLKPDEVGTVVSIVKNSFEPLYLIPSIYRGDGIAHFIAAELQNPYSMYRYFVLYEGDVLAGYAEYKIFENTSTAFLNIIAVNTQYKNQGIGKKLFLYTKNLFEKQGFGAIALDVYESNTIALNWYYGFGFIKTDTTPFYEVNPEKIADPDGSICLQNYPQYRVVQEQYGFYFLDMNVGGESFRIGTIGNDAIVRGSYSDRLSRGLPHIRISLQLDKVYFIGKEIHPDFVFIDRINRMELKINYDNKKSGEQGII
ncbi:GNAT family N-acetyltransferase [Chryseobacterium sp.]|uniref:GNAT family N-acetyltransferase n=1 Tax=Chryseobacterium sp. TaxID=1871047 RepID=UPI0011C923F4|nr:GNAT family N-acetyltransferase [Chryseobacterium sp.]TXF77540.1 GNAT family N-acetyltransferase [Chryseobacterium sp.]